MGDTERTVLSQRPDKWMTPTEASLLIDDLRRTIESLRAQVVQLQATEDDREFHDWVFGAYNPAVEIITEFLKELDQTSHQADHNARAILARLTSAGVTVQKLDGDWS